MMTRPFLLLVIGFGALTPGLGMAGEKGKEAQHIPPPPLQGPVVSQRAAMAVEYSAHSLSSIQSVLTASGVATTKNLEQPRSLLPTSSVLRHPPTHPLQAPAGQGHGPAALGGPSLSNAKSNGVLNGTGFVHKP